jgi:hypothetical protein
MPSLAEQEQSVRQAQALQVQQVLLVPKLA